MINDKEILFTNPLSNISLLAFHFVPIRVLVKSTIADNCTGGSCHIVNMKDVLSIQHDKLTQTQSNVSMNIFIFICI